MEFVSVLIAHLRIKNTQARRDIRAGCGVAESNGACECEREGPGYAPERAHRGRSMYTHGYTGCARGRESDNQMQREDGANVLDHPSRSKDRIGVRDR